MIKWYATIGTIIFLALIWLISFATEAQGACIMSYCKDEAPERSYVRNNWENGRQIVGDIYDPGGGRRLQIRDTDRRIIGYIESDGSVINTNRQEIGEINER